VADGAFAEIDKRHRAALERYVRRLLRSSSDAEDVVQDALVAAHAALIAGEPVRELRAWLYRLARNRAIDEIRRARSRNVELTEDHTDTDRTDPAMIFSRKEAVRRMFEDLAELPDAQRTALMRHELDGAPTDAIATELGVSREATQMLIARARGGLVRARDARDADCHDIRADLVLAGALGKRTSALARGHLEDCAPCRRYRRDLGRVDRRLRLLAPPIWTLPAAIAAKLGGGGAKAVVGAAVVATAAGALLVLDRHTINPGEVSPLRLTAVAPYLSHRVGVGDRLPAGVSLAYAKIEMPAGPIARHASIALSCPAGSVVVGLARPQREVGLGFSFDRVVTRLTSSVRLNFSGPPLPKRVRTRVALVCRRPTPDGSVLANPRPLQAGARAATVCATRSYIKHSPDRVVVGTVFSGEPVAARRVSASGKWTQITPEAAQPGWVLSSALCRAGERPTSVGRTETG